MYEWILRERVIWSLFLWQSYCKQLDQIEKGVKIKIKGKRWGGSVSHLVMSDSLQPMNCSSPGSSVHGILQARILGWVAIPFSRRSSQPRGQIQVSHIAGGFFTLWITSIDNYTESHIIIKQNIWFKVMGELFIIWEWWISYAAY